MSAPTLGKGQAGPVRIDVERLIASRALLCAQSGGGKTWALRRILEQTHGLVQQLVIDPEGELFTLRERHDYVLVGRGGDCVADPRSAGLLARRLLELGTSAILDISELRQSAKPGQVPEREAFVASFCEALVRAPRSLWHPVLVVIDEAHQFCPERGKRAGARGPCADAVIDLMALGRKRGFAPLLATQRLSKLSKDAAAEAGNVFVGRANLPLDVRSMADLLGAGKEGQAQLKRLRPGQFYVFGPAVSDDVELVEVGPVKTTHPKAGKVAPPPAPPRARVKAALQELADLAQQAEAEEREVDVLRARIRDLERELRGARAGGPSPEDLERARAEGASRARRQLAEAVRGLAGRQEQSARVLERVMGDLAKLSDLVRDPIDVDLGAEEAPAARPALARTRPQRESALARPARQSEAPSAGLDGPEQRILDALAWLELVGVSPAQETAVAFLAGYRTGGGAWCNPRGRLRSKGLLEYVGGAKLLGLTDAGRAIARFPDAPGTSDELQKMVLAKLDGPERRILQPLIEAYPSALSNENLAEAAGYAAGGGAYANPRGRLRSLGLVEYPETGMVRASALLFPVPS